jgi:hypothetical protein
MQVAAQEDEIKRLRALLTTTTGELSRQITTFQSDGRAEGARVEWMQKLLIQVSHEGVYMCHNMRL